ncbi:MAG: hypothetical protein E7Z99_09955 [Coriobacteriaceae bacterium]|jgi:hypothetical protein|uniref:plasmid mobilization protein n=1 Tax=Denitrobacterium detoxificans TaxID=79604 RepID=UPI001D694CDB|nr:hypothetical protein [Denitrobacterium detoxificans]MBE6465282.1 hypothetical protein [Denitrobacterium detoxificans]MBE6471632.1 hypothetical protein [Coriobacteriaceae bacterium]MBE6473858.1 hypothetical protein [Coriobacteriaceae bacterium]
MAEKATKRIHMRATPSELSAINRKARTTGLSRSRFMIASALGCELKVTAFDAEPVREANRLLANATGNLNQVARRLNEYGFEAEDVVAIVDAIEELDGQVRELRAALNAMLESGRGLR